ncbi:MAG: hypothetical protein CW338_01445 [Clostridiales bacterium]|nr:hypothetical protein [Clostridiales bacterium]
MDICIPENFFSSDQRDRYYAAASNRRSIRAYSGAPDEDKQAALRGFAENSTLPGARLELLDADEDTFFAVPLAGGITGCRNLAAVICDSRQMHGKLYAGMLGESFVLEAESMGMGSCWVSGSYHRRKVNVSLNEGEKLAAVIAYGVPAKKIETVRKRKKLTDICRSDPSSWPIWAYNAAENVRIAPSAVNMQPWRLAFAGRTLLLLSTPFANELDMGIALLHMTLGLKEKPHQLTFGTGNEVACLIAEDRTL